MWCAKLFWRTSFATGVSPFCSLQKLFMTFLFFCCALSKNPFYIVALHAIFIVIKNSQTFCISVYSGIRSLFQKQLETILFSLGTNSVYQVFVRLFYNFKPFQRGVNGITKKFHYFQYFRQ